MYETRIRAAEETRRLDALHALHILDTPAEQAFDALAALAATILGCPVAMVTLVDDTRLWVKARVGIEVEETARDIAFCDHTIRGDTALVVKDALLDPRFADNPYVTSPGGIRFYAGTPIHGRDPATGDSRRVGAICAVDRVTHNIGLEEEKALGHLGVIADALLAARGMSGEALTIAVDANDRAAALLRADLIFRQAERMAAIGSWRYDIAAEALEWSEGVFRIHEVASDTPPSLAQALDFYPGAERDKVDRIFTATVERGIPFDFETDFLTARGNRRRVRSMADVETVDGRVVAVTGVFQDITVRYEMEQSLRRLAHTDEVTRIANRARFNQVLEGAMEQAAAGMPLLLVLIDLDHFKQLNDTHGHAAGDDVLRAIGQRLRADWLGDSLAARLGGDEFALVVCDEALCRDADGTVARLLAELAAPVPTACGLLPASATIGYATFDAAVHTTLRAFLHSADSALYEAKRSQRGTARRFALAGRRESDGAAGS